MEPIPVPELRQPPDSLGCLPTAVLTVLLWHERRVTLHEVAEWCNAWGGCIWELALAGLREAEIEIEEPTGDPEAFLRSHLNDAENPRPVIVTVIYPWSDWSGDHAGVVTGITQPSVPDGEEIVTFMDPAVGVTQRSWGEFSQAWEDAECRAMVIHP